MAALLTREHAEALRTAELEHRAERRGIDRRKDETSWIGPERRRGDRRTVELRRAA